MKRLLPLVRKSPLKNLLVPPRQTAFGSLEVSINYTFNLFSQVICQVKKMQNKIVFSHKEYFIFNLMIYSLLLPLKGDLLKVTCVCPHWTEMIPKRHLYNMGYVGLSEVYLPLFLLRITFFCDSRFSVNHW